MVTLLSGFGSEEQYIDTLLAKYEARRDDLREFALRQRVLLLLHSSGIPFDVALGALPFEENSVRRASFWRTEIGGELLTCSAEDLIVHKSFAARDLDWSDVDTRRNAAGSQAQYWTNLDGTAAIGRAQRTAGNPGPASGIIRPVPRLMKPDSGALSVERADTRGPSESILGLRFFKGAAKQAAAEMSASGGLLVAPSGTCFERFQEDEEYRRALTTADVVLADSGLMVTLWRLLRGRKVPRISGLAYLKQLLADPGLRAGRVLWVLPHDRARAKLLAWAKTNRAVIDPADCYIGPIYSRAVEDGALLALVESRKPRHIIIAIGAGAQEKLGWYLRENANWRPAIHCIGGALGFVTGEQIAIPDWADRLYLGWLLRLLSQPRIFIPRLWKARLLPILIYKYGGQLPPMRERR